MLISGCCQKIMMTILDILLFWRTKNYLDQNDVKINNIKL